MKLFLVCVMAVLAAFVAPEPMYKVRITKAELTYANTSLTDDYEFLFRKINRTTLALNAHYNLLVDLSHNKIMGSLTIDKLFGTEYKKTGTGGVMNVCTFLQKNMFGMREQIEKHGNITGCSVGKGYYYIKDYIVDPVNFPRYLPYGSYRVELKAYEDSVSYFTMVWYATVEQLVKRN